MVAETEVVSHHAKSVSDEYICIPCTADDPDFLEVSPKALDLTRSESGFACSTSIQTNTVFETPTNNFTLKIRSGSHTDIGSRSFNDDRHIRIDDLCTHLGSLHAWSKPSSFYAVFDGHGGADAAAYMKDNAMRIFFEDTELPQTPDIDEKFLQILETAHRQAFLLADRALADEHSIVDDCGTTALTALVLGRHLLIANAGDCRAVLCRKGDAVQLSRDHRPSCQLERKRVEDLGAKIEYERLNGDLTVTRALGDWYMKLPFGSESPLTAEPEFQRTLLTEDDEFLIIGCDGIWDELSNEDAVGIVRHELRQNNDPQQCARELINQALMRGVEDNVTAIVVCFSSPDIQESACSQRPGRLRFLLSEEARSKIMSFLEDN